MIFVISCLIMGLTLIADPIIEIPNMDVELGELLPEQTKHHSFTVKNIGDKDLILDKIVPSCGCTTTLFQEKVIPPGKSTTIESDITMPAHEGPIRKNIEVLSNDTKNPQLTLYLNAVVKSDYKLNPPRINLGELFIGDKKNFTFTLTPINKKPYDPLKLDYQTEIFTVKTRPLEPENPLTPYEFTVEYYASPKFFPRKAYESIKIFPYKDKLSETLTLEFPIIAEIKGYIKISETSVFRSIEKNKNHTEVINYKHLKDTPFQIISATTDNNKATTKIIKVSESEYNVELTLTADPNSRRENVILTVDTDQPDGKKLKSFFTFVLQRL